MFKSISDIITAVGSSPRKMWTMVIILLFISAITIFTKLIEHSDCASQDKEISTLIKTQSELIDENQVVITKNEELVKGYVKIQGILSSIKPDTVFIIKTSKYNANIVKPSPQSAGGSVASDQIVSDTSMVMVSADVKPQTQEKMTTTIVKKYKKSSDGVVQKINNLIEAKIKTEGVNAQ